MVLLIPIIFIIEFEILGIMSMQQLFRPNEIRLIDSIYRNNFIVQRRKLGFKGSLKSYKFRVLQQTILNQH